MKDHYKITHTHDGDKRFYAVIDIIENEVLHIYHYKNEIERARACGKARIRCYELEKYGA